ncbi:F-box protein [Acorus calamus]|uniref:F-box protein n=1 Tax=Acorus calamus TaxID=4465 RepID=A0AAV9ENW0_ACOCL|nr:F-box protein [Acorus calamus]
MDGVDFGILPEGCISHVVSLTTPRDACRSSQVSSMLRAASESDLVWERFLPSDYREVLSRAVDHVEFSSKKELYFRLCRPILIDGGKKSFALDRSTGKKIYMLSAKELCIIWGDTPQYWNWISPPESRFPQAAELISVCWLEIRGKIDVKTLSPKTTYAAYLVMKLTDEAFGLSSPLQDACVKFRDHVSSHKVHIQPDAPRRSRFGFRGPIIIRHRPLRRGQGQLMLPPPTLPEEEAQAAPEEAREATGEDAWRVPCGRGDGWREVELGEFYVEEGAEGEVEMSLTEVKGGNWKKGLIVQGIEVRPKEK